MGRHWVLLVFAVAHGLGCATAQGPADTAAHQRCWPEFPYQSGWLGADSAYSVPIAPDQTVWLFGDTFVSETAQSNRQGAAFIHNSIGVSRCRPDGTWTIDYAWGRNTDGAAKAFLERPETNAWWWLFDGFTHAGRLYIGLLDVAEVPPHGPLALPFSFSGVQLARVANPRAAPSEWQLDVLPLTTQANPPRMLPASAMLVHGDHVYLFAFLDPGDGSHPRGLARIALSDLDTRPNDLANAVEYFARDGRWKPGLDASDAAILMADTSTEMSVTPHPSGHGWLALYNYPDVGPGFPTSRPSDAVWVRTARELTGPWSERRLIFRIPELAPDYAGGFDRNTACYAAKEHPQFARQDHITFTYVCNLFTGPDEDPMRILERLTTSMGLYRPIPAAIDVPAAAIGAP